MPKYRNDNTGDIVEYDEPDPRLEALPNWQRIDEPEPKPAPAKKAPQRKS